MFDKSEAHSCSTDSVSALDCIIIKWVHNITWFQTRDGRATIAVTSKMELFVAITSSCQPLKLFYVINTMILRSLQNCSLCYQYSSPSFRNYRKM